MWPWKKREAQIAQTAFGEFVKESDKAPWECFVEIGDTEVQVLAKDINGQPNAELLKQLPVIIENLQMLENVAREAVPELSAQHFFDYISDTLEDAQFRLGFSYEEENWGETVFVGFKDGKVTGWSSVD